MKYKGSWQIIRNNITNTHHPVIILLTFTIFKKIEVNIFHKFLSLFIYHRKNNVPTHRLLMDDWLMCTSFCVLFYFSFYLTIELWYKYNIKRKMNFRIFFKPILLYYTTTRVHFYTVELVKRIAPLNKRS